MCIRDRNLLDRIERLDLLLFIWGGSI